MTININEILTNEKEKGLAIIRKSLREMKLDKRKKYILVVDVEATTRNGTQLEMQQGKNLFYDLGFMVTDKKGTNYLQGSLLVDEIWNDESLMNSAYYANKIPLYEQKLKDNLIHVLPFLEIRKLLRFIVDKFNVTQFSAYNLSFDIGSLNYTSYQLTDSYNSHFFGFNQRKNLKKVDIWTLVCKTVFIQKGFPGFCADNGFISPKGNYETTAEVAYSYLNREPEFEEEHTGLADVFIEVELMKYAYRQRKKIGDTYEWDPWRKANNFIKHDRKNW